MEEEVKEKIIMRLTSTALLIFAAILLYAIITKGPSPTKITFCLTSTIIGTFMMILSFKKKEEEEVVDEDLQDLIDELDEEGEKYDQ